MYIQQTIVGKVIRERSNVHPANNCWQGYYRQCVIPTVLNSDITISCIGLTETTGRTSALHVKILNTFRGIVCGDITNGRWVQQKIGVTTNRCNNKQVQQQIGIQVQQQIYVATNRCSNKYMQQHIGVATNRCSNKMIKQQTDVATNRFSNKWM